MRSFIRIFCLFEEVEKVNDAASQSVFKKLEHFGISWNDSTFEKIMIFISNATDFVPVTMNDYINCKSLSRLTMMSPCTFKTILCILYLLSVTRIGMIVDITWTLENILMTKLSLYRFFIAWFYKCVDFNLCASRARPRFLLQF